MKKILYGIFLCLFIPFTINGATFKTKNQNIRNKDKVKILIEQNLNQNENEIKKLANYIDLDDRNELYDAYKYNGPAGWPIAVVIGFGFGNYMMGDTIGGSITLFGELLCILAAYAMPASSSSRLTIGLGGTITFHIYGIIRALQYPSIYNNKLQFALHLSSDVSLRNTSLDKDITTDPWYGASIAYKF